MATLTIGGKTALTQTDTEEPILKNNVLNFQNTPP